MTSATRTRAAWVWSSFISSFLVAVCLYETVPPAFAREKRLKLVAVGDVNLNRTRQEVRKDGIYLWGKVVPFSSMFDRIRKQIDGDVNFCNLETTVMDRNDIEPVKKEYNFRSHPNAVRALQDVGFNLLSIANNHIKDYGTQGCIETRRWLDKLAKERPLYYAGAGANLDEACRLGVFKVNGIRVAFGALSISTPADKKRAGVASVYAPELLLKRLKEAKADLRILSVHAGDEKVNRPNRTQLRVARLAIEKYDVNIVLGHHAHVVQGVELYKGGLIFYGLGNFAMRGAANMGSVPEFRGERDFGLLAKVYVVYDTKKKHVWFERVEAFPVYDMHSGPHLFQKEEDAAYRIEVLNKLSTEKYLGRGHKGLVFKSSGRKGVWTPTAD